MDILNSKAVVALFALKWKNKKNYSICEISHNTYAIIII